MVSRLAWTGILYRIVYVMELRGMGLFTAAVLFFVLLALPSLFFGALPDRRQAPSPDGRT